VGDEASTAGEVAGGCVGTFPGPAHPTRATIMRRAVGSAQFER
jgi:hypothetical protein